MILVDTLGWRLEIRKTRRRELLFLRLEVAQVSKCRVERKAFIEPEKEVGQMGVNKKNTYITTRSQKM